MNWMRLDAAAMLFTGVLLIGPDADAQPVFNANPDWESSDTPRSTGAALVDLDRDGWLDFVVGNGNDILRQQNAVYYNDGAGALPLTPDWLSGDEEYNGHVAIGDVNGDGWQDVAVGLTLHGEGAPSARLYLNHNGTLSPLPDWESANGHAAFHVTFGDMNNDGRPDLIVGTGWPYSDPHIWQNEIYMNIGGALETSPSWLSDDTWDIMDTLAVDVNRDGWLDLVAAGTNTDTWVYMNDGGRVETTASWRTTDNDGQFTVFATYGDVDDDGWFDLFTVDNDQIFEGSGDFRRYDGLPGAPFTQTPTWTYFDGFCSAVTLVDVDADGLLDLVTGAWFDASRYFLNNGGVYGAAPDWTSTATSVVEAIAAGDVDKDGVRHATDVFNVAGDQHLFYMSHQPIERIDHVLVDGQLLPPSAYTADTVHGWVTVGPTPNASVAVRYVYSLKPDLAISNWDGFVGNFLYYNNSDARRLGDFDGDDAVDTFDYGAYLDCVTGPAPATPPPAACLAAFDGDTDADIDFADFGEFQWSLGGAR